MDADSPNIRRLMDIKRTDVRPCAVIQESLFVFVRHRGSINPLKTAFKTLPSFAGPDPIEYPFP